MSHIFDMGSKDLRNRMVTCHIALSTENVCESISINGGDFLSIYLSTNAEQQWQRKKQERIRSRSKFSISFSRDNLL